MTSKEINQSIESLKIKLTRGEKIDHWLNFFSLLIPLFSIGITTIYLPLLNGEITVIGIIILIAFILLLRHKLLSPKIEVFKSELTSEQFKLANQAAATLNEWVILSNRRNFFQAIKGTSWQWDGIKITAILKNGKIYLNSMVNPSLRSNPLTFGLNKKNKLALIQQYQLILKGSNVIENAEKEVDKTEKEFWEKSEWTIKNSLKRIIIYGLSVLLIILGAWMITTGEIGAILIGIFLIGYCSSYIYLDIQIIREKRRKKPGYNNG